MRCPWLSQLETAFQTTLEDIKGRLAAAACILTAARACLSPWLQLVAAFRATLEEIQDASLLLHVVDVSHPNAPAQVRVFKRLFAWYDLCCEVLLTLLLLLLLLLPLLLLLLRCCCRCCCCCCGAAAAAAAAAAVLLPLLLLLLHLVDVSHPNAPAQVRPRPAGLSRYNKHRIISPTAQQIDAVNRVLEELGVQNIPTLNVWNKVRG